MEGIDCDSLQSVLDQATTALADFAQDAVPGAKLRELAVQVRDDQDRPVLQAILRLEIKTLSEAVSVMPHVGCAQLGRE